MFTQRHNIHRDVILQENAHVIGMAAYPVDLSLFLDMSLAQLDPEDSSYVFSSKGADPVVVAQCALACWNEYVTSRGEKVRETFLKAALWLVEHAQYIGDDAAGWPLAYAHSLYFTKGSWLSSVAQGCSLSVLARAYQLTSDPCFLEIANCVARTFERDILDGGVCTPLGADSIFFEEVAVYPAAHTLHGDIFALLGLYDYVAIIQNQRIHQQIQRGEATLHSVFEEFDLGFWTRTDLLRRDLTTPVQLAQQIMLLKALVCCNGCSRCAERASRWQKYQRGLFSRLRYAFDHRMTLLKQVLLRRAQTVIVPQSSTANPRPVPHLRVCVPVMAHPVLGGRGTFLDRMAHLMADRWQMEYLTQHIGSDVGKRVMHQFGRTWTTPWHFPQVWLYTLSGFRKLLSLMQQGMNYDLIIPQDGVFSGAFAALAGKLTGVRVVCFDHSTLTCYKSQAYRAERWSYLDGKAWPWLFRQLVRILLAFYWPSLYILARFAAGQADHLLSPGVPGDEVDEICRELHIPPSHVTRFNLTVDMQRHTELSVEERAARRARMNIPSDSLVIAITVRLELEKGLDISMESINRALSALPAALRDRVRVMIAGDGKLRGWLEEEIRQRGLSHICLMMGNISSEEVYSLLAVSDISLHTSTRGVCMPTAVLEGMAAGCAVIASTEPLANVRVLAEERGMVVQAGDVEQTSQALERLLSDSDLRDQMGKAAREYIALHHSAEAFRRVLLRASYWSDVEQLIETQAESLEANERTERK